MYLLLTVVALLFVWTALSYFVERTVKSPTYTVLERKQGYEIRSYEPYVTAQVEVSGTYDEALRQGFIVLADYIFGNNTKRTSIAMTAPVSEVESETLAMTAPVLVKENQKLAMTAPVLERSTDTNRIVSFVMPFEYTLETLPKPNNVRVKLVPQDARTVAVLRFSWFRGAERVAHKKQELLSLLERDRVILKGAPEYAGYNAPFTAPWMRRHEVLVELE